ncbi:GNAT family N-acetyltransferase [Streptomyces cacaoi]|uniref:Lysine N-acyltransferase MbtK n=1 Tax=Streptomyces cacaoi TaxID=1898 RepID=A0A4Y3QX32_STRCI|nr:acetyltransferase [Streptomyces cacaoi]QHF96620.1 N-acetyltransferase [Streptomyces sp. NHF165]GEB49976.1 N-acetyltransferase [Streptomyces cacaoi]
MVLPQPHSGAARAAEHPGTGTMEPGASLRDDEDTLDLEIPEELKQLSAGRVHPGRRPAATAPGGLLDAPADWPAVATPAGLFRFAAVEPARDLPLITAWMNDPAVAAFWELAGPPEVTAAHLRPQIEGDGRSVPLLGLLDGVPMSYWELYRADLDPLARYCRTLPHDTGVHLLLGRAAHRGHGTGTALLRAVADLVLDRRPRCSRVLAEPDLSNTPSVAAFLSAGFRLSAEVELPDKRAALMVRDRVLREAL